MSNPHEEPLPGSQPAGPGQPSVAPGHAVRARQELIRRSRDEQAPPPKTHEEAVLRTITGDPRANAGDIDRALRAAGSPTVAAAARGAAGGQFAAHATSNSTDLVDHVRNLVETYKDQAWDHETRQRVYDAAADIQRLYALRLLAGVGNGTVTDPSTATPDSSLGLVMTLEQVDRELRLSIQVINSVATRSAYTGAAILQRAINDWMGRLLQVGLRFIAPPTV